MEPMTIDKLEESRHFPSEYGPPCELNLFRFTKERKFINIHSKNTMNKETIFQCVFVLLCMSIRKMHKQFVGTKKLPIKMRRDKKKKRDKYNCRNHHFFSWFSCVFLGCTKTTSDIHHWVSLQLQTLIIVNLFTNCRTKTLKYSNYRQFGFFLAFFFHFMKSRKLIWKRPFFDSELPRMIYMVGFI